MNSKLLFLSTFLVSTTAFATTISSGSAALRWAGDGASFFNAVTPTYSFSATGNPVDFGGFPQNCTGVTQVVRGLFVDTQCSTPSTVPLTFSTASGFTSSQNFAGPLVATISGVFTNLDVTQLLSTNGSGLAPFPATGTWRFQYSGTIQVQSSINGAIFLQDTITGSGIATTSLNSLVTGSNFRTITTFAFADTTVPEPSTAALGVAGLGLLALARRRAASRSKQQ